MCSCMADCDPIKREQQTGQLAGRLTWVDQGEDDEVPPGLSQALGTHASGWVRKH